MELAYQPMVEIQKQYNSLEYVLKQSCFVELQNNDFWVIDLKYATADNFMNEDVYHEFNRAFLHKDAYDKLIKAAQNLKKINSGYKFIIYDVLRPRSVQWKMWSKVKGTDEQQYIANPESGSNHNFGMAIDLSIVDKNDAVLNMGSGFDEFTELSQPRHEARFINEKLLSAEHIQNRHVLKASMEQAGFRQLASEWWHFDALPKLEIREKYQIVE